MGIIKGLLKLVGIVVIVIVVAVFGTLTAARFADGPWAIIAGGSFSSGEVVTTEPDWSFIKDVGEVQFELEVTGRSRTSWVMEHEGRVFIPSGYMNSTVGKIWKHWPYDAEKDGRILLRVDGKIYPRNMRRVMQDDPDMPYVLGEVARKYLPQMQASADGGLEDGLNQIATGNLWVFELLPRDA